MDEMTQQNAALVEEAAAASESMDEQGKNLQRLMSFFEIGQDIAASVETAPVEEEKPTTPAKKRTAKKKAAAKKASPAESNDDEWDEF